MNFWDSTSKRKILRRCSFKQESGFWLPWVRRIWDKSRSGDFHKTIIIESPLQHGDWETESVDGSQRHGQIAFRYIGEYCGSIANHPCKSWSSSTFGAQKLRSLSQAWYSWRWLPDICQWLWHSGQSVFTVGLTTNTSDSLIHANTFATLGSLPQWSSIDPSTPWWRHQLILIPSDPMEGPTCLANLIPSFLVHFCWFLQYQVFSTQIPLQGPPHPKLLHETTRCLMVHV